MFTYSRTDVDRLDAVANLLLRLVWYCVGHNDFLEAATIQRFNSVPTQDTVSDDSDSVLCSALVNQNACGFNESTARVRHIVDENGSLASHFSDKCHPRHLIGTSALFVNKRKGQIQTISDRSRPVPGVSIVSQ